MPKKNIKIVKITNRLNDKNCPNEKSCQSIECIKAVKI